MAGGSNATDPDPFQVLIPIGRQHPPEALPGLFSLVLIRHVRIMPTQDTLLLTYLVLPLMAYGRPCIASMRISTIVNTST